MLAMRQAGGAGGRGPEAAAGDRLTETGRSSCGQPGGARPGGQRAGGIDEMLERFRRYRRRPEGRRIIAGLRQQGHEPGRITAIKCSQESNRSFVGTATTGGSVAGKPEPDIPGLEGMDIP